MAEAKSPIICITCQREFPDDLKADDPRAILPSTASYPERGRCLHSLPTTVATQMPLEATEYASKAGGMVKDAAGQALMSRMQGASKPPPQPPMRMPQSPQLAGAAPLPSMGYGRMPSGAGDHETMIRQLLARYS